MDSSEETRIRVLHIFSPSLKKRFGGQNITWKYNFRNWDDRRITHLVLDTSKVQLIGSREAFDFKYADTQELPTRWERATWIFALFKGLIQYKKEYDILHVHILWWGSLLVAPLAKWGKRPSIYESVLLGADTPSGIIREKFGKVKLWFLKEYKAILAISDFLAEDYLDYGFSKQQVFMLMNSVDTALFRPVESDEVKAALREKNNLPGNANILVFVGSVIARKGVDILVRAFIEASRKRPDLHLVIIGAKNKKENPSLDEGFVNRLYAMLEQDGMSDRVSFLGLVQDREQLAEIYRAADIFTFPSRVEGLGNVVLEAMASGLPVVVSQLPVLGEVIHHGENGIFVPIGDVATLEDAILQVSMDPDQAKKIGMVARSSVLQRHSFQAWQSNLVSIYQGLLDKYL